MIILALIPAYDEEQSISEVITETKKYVDKLILIDDGSTDRTPEIADRLGAIVLRHANNLGVGCTMCTGIDYAKKLKPDLLITIDGDGQHDPKDIPKLLHPIVSGQADFVLASRFLQGRPDIPLIKFIGNKLLSSLVSILIGVKVNDTQTGFRALNTKALLALNLEGEQTYVQEMVIDLCLKGFTLQEIPIQSIPRKHGNSKVTSNIFKYIFKVIPIIFHAFSRSISHRRTF